MAGAMVTWERWRPDFAMLIDPRFYTLEWLDDQLMRGEMHLMATHRAAILTTFKDYPTGTREIHGMAAVGEMDEIVRVLIPAAEEFGRINGCIVATIESRAGWKRVLEPSGYAPHQICLRKEL